MSDKIPRLGTIAKACEIIGGDKPIAPSTFYRGVKAGRYRPPIKVGENTSRVDLDGLADDIRACINGEKA
jgi:hypothetical protein